MGRSIAWCLGALLVVPGAALAQDVPKATPEGVRAVDDLVAACVAAGGLKPGATPDAAPSLADPDKLRAAVRANARLLTPALRDALVAGWFRPDPPRQEVHAALLRAYGEEKKDDRALGFAAFFAGVRDREAGKPEDACARFAEAERRFDAAGAPTWQALALSNLGLVHARQEKYAEAVEFYRKALELQRKTYAGPHRDIAASLANLGAVHDRLGKYAESRDYHRQALEVERKLADGPDADVAYRLGEVGSACYKLGDYAEALEWYRRQEAELRRLHDGPDADLASCLWHVGVTCDRLRDYPAALDAHAAALAMRRQLHDGPHPDVAASEHSVGQAYLQLNRFDEAVTHYERALEQRRQLYRPPHRLLAESLDALGMACGHAGKHDRAAALLEEGLAMRRKLYDGPHPEVARSLTHLGSLYAGLGRPEKALDYHLQAVIMRQKLDPPDLAEIAVSWNNVGSALAALGRYRQALEAHHRSLELKEKLYRPPHPSLATSLNNIGHVHELLGEYDEALRYAEQALDMRQRSARGPDPEVAASWLNVGGVRHRRGELAEALRCHRKALELYRQTYRGPHPDVAFALAALGTDYYAQGEYGRALEFYREGYDLRRRVFDAPHPLLADSLNNIAAAAFQLDDYPAALQAWRDALDMDRRLAAGPSADVAMDLNNLGAVHTYRGEFADALRCQREALEIRQALFKGPHPDVALSLFNLAAVHERLGEDDRALDLDEQAVAMWRQVYGPRHPEVAVGLNNVASLRHRRGAHDGALAAANEALEALRPPGAEGPLRVEGLRARDLRPLPLTVNVLFLRGQALEGLAGREPTVGRWLACEKSYALAAEVLDELRDQVLERDASKLVQVEQFSSLVPRRLAVRARLLALRGGAEDARAAFAVVEQGRARVFLEGLGRANASRLAGLPADLRAEEDRLRHAYRLADAELRAAQALPGEDGAARRVAVARRRQQAEDDLLAFEQRLAKSHPQYAALRYPQPCSVEEARRCLDDNEVALLFAIGEDESFAVVLHKKPDPKDQSGGVAVVRLPGRKTLAEQVEGVTQRERLKRVAGTRALAAGLYRDLLGPLADQIRGKDLVVVPDGPLCLLPFELLVEPDGHYLIENRRVRYAPSMTALHMTRLWDEGRNTRPDRPLVAFGDPIFCPDDERLRGAVELAGATREALQGLRTREGRSPDGAFDRLTASGAEVRAVARLLHAEDALHTGADATEALVKRLSVEGELARARYVHFATHGVLGLGRGQPPALVLTLVGTSGKEDEFGRDDGFLTLPEVSGLKLNADLVVLSACRTGQGRLHNGEGVSGLARVFLYAGSRGVVCSLWSVDDEATADLMRLMYQRLGKGDSAADALRQAKLALIADGQPPLLWAPFILMGR